MSADDDRRIGSAIRALRKERRMSQGALVEEMRARGHSHWHQTTVSRVEHGTQGLRAGEVAALSDVFGVEVTAADHRQSQRNTLAALERKGVEVKLRRALDALAEAERAVWEALG